MWDGVSVPLVGWIVGAGDGTFVGPLVGVAVGVREGRSDCDGFSVGRTVGDDGVLDGKVLRLGILLGDTDGAPEATFVGAFEATKVGVDDGDPEALTLGSADGESECLLVGISDGPCEGSRDGELEGRSDGIIVGSVEASTLGFSDGEFEAWRVGVDDGKWVGAKVGDADGEPEGFAVGDIDGEDEGDGDGGNDGDIDGKLVTTVGVAVGVMQSSPNSSQRLFPLVSEVIPLHCKPLLMVLPHPLLFPLVVTAPDPSKTAGPK